MAQNTRDWIEIDKEFKAKKPKFLNICLAECPGYV